MSKVPAERLQARRFVFHGRSRFRAVSAFTIRAMTDQPRFVARTMGYTSWAGHAVDPLEAVDAATQAGQTREAHTRWAKEQARRWGQAARTINGAIADFTSGGVIDRRVLSDLRAISRAAAKVSRRLDA